MTHTHTTKLSDCNCSIYIYVHLHLDWAAMSLIWVLILDKNTIWKTKNWATMSDMSNTENKYHMKNKKIIIAVKCSLAWDR